MNKYINTNTLEYNITEDEIKSLFPNTSFPESFTPPSGYQLVFPTPQPSINRFQIAREIQPLLTDKGFYEQQWEVVDKFQDLTTKSNLESIELANYKQELKQIVVKKREDNEMAGFTYNGKEYDSDLKAIIRISNAAQVAVTNPNFSVFWTAKDNTESLLTGAELIELQAALVAHISIIHINSRTLKQQIDSASTLAELELIGV